MSKKSHISFAKWVATIGYRYDFDRDEWFSPFVAWTTSEDLWKQYKHYLKFAEKANSKTI